jgi:hypothetical protein
MPLTLEADYELLDQQIKDDRRLTASHRRRLRVLVQWQKSGGRNPQHLLTEALRRKAEKKEKLTDDEKAALEWDFSEDSVRNDLASVRRALKNRVWTLEDNRECVLDIPERDRTHYRLEAHLPDPHQRMWGSHVTHHQPVRILLFERLFFRYKHDLYLRSTKVNRNESKGILLESLALAPEILPELIPSRHYVSAGELQAAIALQDVFANWFNVMASLRGYEEEHGATSGNDILLAASRVDDAKLRCRPYEYFEAAEEGVLPKFTDNTDNPASRIVHVLLTRRHEDNSFRTILQGSHGRAIQGVCKHLSETGTLGLVLNKIKVGERRLPHRLQIVFRTVLEYNSDTNVTRCESVEVVDQKFYSDQRSRKKATRA